MSAALHLARLTLDRRMMLRVAREHGHPRFDPGYILHAALSEAFARSDDPAKVPFHSFAEDPIQPSADRLRVLAYSAAGERELRALLGPKSEGLVVGVDTREMPTLARGTKARFWTRVCPTVRSKRTGDHPLARDRRGRPRARELDAYVHATLDLPLDARTNGVALPSREEVYGRWMARQLGEAAELHPDDIDGPVRIAAMRREAIYRQSVDPHGARGERPNVVLEGTLTVQNEAVFSAVLARGLGRHRAFGFGMLLLRGAG